MSEPANDRDDLNGIIVAQWFRLKPERQREHRSISVALDITRRWLRAFAAICAQDGDAASIAVRHGWVATNARESWEDITAAQIEQKIRDIQRSPFSPMLGSFFAAALGKHAPHHLPLLPPAWIAASQANQR